MVDPSLIIQTWLRTADTALYTLCAARVYAMPPGLPGKMAVVDSVSFQISGGMGPMTPAKLESVFVEFHCWSSSAYGAHAVAAALHEVAHNADHVSVTISAKVYRIIRAIRTGAIQVFPNPTEPAWFFALCPYEITVLNKDTSQDG